MKLLKLLLLFCITTCLQSQNNFSTKYFRHLKYNHVSPYLNLEGTYPINEQTAKSTSHYRFKYNNSGKIIEITNNHYHTERQHPLASLGVYKVDITYPEGQEIRVFYNKNGKRISNDRDVFKEVYTYNSKGFKSKLQFFDVDNHPMESNWGIAEYKWEKHKKLIIENRYNLINEPVSLSPYFKFGTTGILLDKNENPKAHYNLDTKLNIINNDKGTASYHDLFDENGNHIKYSYYDVNDDLVMNQWGFAYGIKVYDDLGNQIGLNQFNTQNEQIRSRDIPTNSKIELASKASQIDSLEIRRIATGYLVALQDLKPELMREVMNDSLNKITIGWDRETKKEYARATTKTQMIDFATSWNKSNTKFPLNPTNNITILDIYNRIANVKLVSDNWVEYLHLIKLDGKWTIANLIWQHKDVNRYPKE